MPERSALTPGERVAFLLSLVPFLIATGGASVQEIAEQFELDERTVHDAVRLLPFLGVPGDSGMYLPGDVFDIDYDQLESDGYVTLTHAVVIDRSPRFTTQELATVLMGLSLIAAALPDDLKSVATDVMAKLGEAAGPAVSARHIDSELTALKRGIAEQRRMEIDYVDAAGEATTRTIEPLSLMSTNGVWYVRAWSVGAEGERTFRIDRIRRITLTEHAFGDHDGSRRPLPHGNMREVAVHVAPTARSFLSWFPGAATGGGTTTRTAAGEVFHVAVGNVAALVRSVMAYPGRVEVVSEDDIRAELAERADRALAQYDAGHAD